MIGLPTVFSILIEAKLNIAKVFCYNTDQSVHLTPSNYFACCAINYQGGRGRLVVAGGWVLMGHYGSNFTSDFQMNVIADGALVMEHRSFPQVSEGSLPLPLRNLNPPVKNERLPVAACQRARGT